MTASRRAPLPYVVTPSSTSGNYFRLTRKRFAAIAVHGQSHDGRARFVRQTYLVSGLERGRRGFSQHAVRGEIDFERADTSLSDRAIFTNRDGTSGPAAMHLANTQLGGYVQDLWRPWKPIVFSVGVRTDWDRFIHENVFQPRIAMNWVPADDGRMNSRWPGGNTTSR